MNAPPLVLFAISDTGGGHRSAAAALDAALELYARGAVRRRTEDLLVRSGFPLLRSAPGLYAKLSTQWIRAFDILYRLTDGPLRMDILSALVWAHAGPALTRMFVELRPQLVVSVHPLANRLIGHARRAVRHPFRFVVVVTDLVSLHAAWSAPGADLVVAPSDEAARQLLAHGVPASRLARADFPVHPKFVKGPPSRCEARAALGLPRGRFTLLLTGGAVGSGQLQGVARDLLAAMPDSQLLVVTGKNTALRAELQAAQLAPGTRIFGYVANMETLMAASDVVITKGGPGTLMEACAIGRPVIVTEAVGPQEHGNLAFVRRHSIGRYCPSVATMIPVLHQLRDTTGHSPGPWRPRHLLTEGALQTARIVLEQLAEGEDAIGARDLIGRAVTQTPQVP